MSAYLSLAFSDLTCHREDTWPWSITEGGKTSLVSFDQLNSSGAIDVKINGCNIDENHLLRYCDCLFFYILLILPSLLFFDKSNILPCMKYCCYFWNGAPNCYLDKLNKLQKPACRTLSPTFLFLLNL